MFLGSLTTAQKDLLEKHITESPFPMELRLKNKEWVFQQFLKEQESVTARKNFVRDFYQHPETYDLPEYQTAMKNYRRNLEKLIANILMTLTPDQKKDLRELAGESDAAGADSSAFLIWFYFLNVSL